MGWMNLNDIVLVVRLSCFRSFLLGLVLMLPIMAAASTFVSILLLVFLVAGRSLGAYSPSPVRGHIKFSGSDAFCCNVVVFSNPYSKPMSILAT